MAERERIKREIAKLAARPRAVEFAEIERIVKALGRLGYDVESESGRHSHLFRVGTEPFTVCKHNPKRKELKACYVRGFLAAMQNLGLYGEGDVDEEP